MYKETTRLGILKFMLRIGNKKQIFLNTVVHISFQKYIQITSRPKPPVSSKFCTPYSTKCARNGRRSCPRIDYQSADERYKLHYASL